MPIYEYRCEKCGSHFEVILINDGSPDDSWEVITRLSQQYPWLRGINLMRNYGQHNALLAGIRAARYQIIVTMDDDGQHPPDQIPALLVKLDEGFDVVYGAPEVTREGFWRIVGSQITRFLIVTTMGVRVPSNGSSFRAFRTMLREGFADYVSPFVAIDVLLSWGTTRFGVVTVKHEARRVGKSKLTIRVILRSVGRASAETARPNSVVAAVAARKSRRFISFLVRSCRWQRRQPLAYRRKPWGPDGTSPGSRRSKRQPFDLPESTFWQDRSACRKPGIPH